MGIYMNTEARQILEAVKSGSMSVDEALKYIISMGVVTPQDAAALAGAQPALPPA